MRYVNSMLLSVVVLAAAGLTKTVNLETPQGSSATLTIKCLKTFVSGDATKVKLTVEVEATGENVKAFRFNEASATLYAEVAGNKATLGTDTWDDQKNLSEDGKKTVILKLSPDVTAAVNAKLEVRVDYGDDIKWASDWTDTKSTTLDVKVKPAE